MAPGEPSAPAASRPVRLRGVALTLYGTLLLAGLAIPDAALSTLREARPSVVTATLLSVVEPVAGFMERTGVPGLYRAARDRFRQIACGAPDSENPC